MLIAGLAANEHFAWKVAHVDHRSVVPTVSVCSSVGLVESARSSCVLRREYTLSRGPNRRVYTARTLSSWLVEWLPCQGCCWKGSFVCLCPTSGHLVWGTLHLGALQELIHQGRLLCKGARQLYDLSRQVLFSIWIGRAWKKCVSLSSGSVVDSGHEI